MKYNPIITNKQKEFNDKSENRQIYKGNKQTSTIDNRYSTRKRSGSYFKKRRKIKNIINHKIQWPNELKSPKDFKGFYWSDNLEF
mmetsp:Transcript_10310/g.9104  ORF Transcript_10310/g.9104 Transcript_10310/m.9104 type:complete len:85 (+) Transcript_10310:339-593(+)